MKILIIGSGYVGLVTGVCLSEKGHQVLCYEKDNLKVKKINSGDPIIFEKGLKKILKKNLRLKKFQITNDKKFAMNFANVAFVCVGTPSKKRKLDFTYIDSAIKDVIKERVKKDYFSIVIKSTVLPGTTSIRVKKIFEKNKKFKFNKNFGLGMNPEFLREGDAVEDFMFPDRIIIGSEDKKTKKSLDIIYSKFKTTKIHTNTKTAEITKYFNNAMLASFMSIINEFSNLSSKSQNINFQKVLEGLKSDKRWVSKNKKIPEILNYFIPGPGYGGSCLPKDTTALLNYSKNIKHNMNILQSVISTNKNQVKNCLNLIPSKTKSILILGMSFKPETNDLRESVSLKMLDLLKKSSMKVYITDPVSKLPKKNKYKNIIFISSWKNIISKVDCILLSTPWKEYKKLEVLKIKNKIIIDFRNFYDPIFFQKNKNKYISLGNS
jgi:UDPglucose 6-dehydrogenase